MIQDIEIDDDIIEVELEPEFYTEVYLPGDVIGMGLVHHKESYLTVEHFYWDKTKYTDTQNSAIDAFIRKHFDALEKEAIQQEY